jgi:cyclophilin family peptidyl-prolyl cis-trans isomerase
MNSSNWHARCAVGRVLRGLRVAVCCVILVGCQQQVQDVAASSDAGGSAAASDSLDLPITNYYEITTVHGRMVIRLYDETPLHRDNFKKLAGDGFYDGTTFHRIIAGFMIQGGDPNSRDDDPGNDGLGGPGYTVPAEFVPGLYHKRGALAAARTGDQVNPERRSSGSQFYIVHGSPLDSMTLGMIEMQIQMATRNSEFRFSEEMRQSYLDEGGAPNLDLQYTVFGEVVEGLEVLDAIATVATPRAMGQPAPPQFADRPIEDVTMQVKPLPDYSE